MIKKQTKITIILALLALVLGLLYFLVIAPMLNQSQDGEKEKYDKDGDLLDAVGSAYVFEPIERQNVAKITVQNQNGTFTLKRDTLTDELVFEGAERLPYDQTKISALYVDTCNMTCIQKIENAKQDLSIYGLDMSQNPAKITVTAKDGATHNVFVGQKLVTGGAYYVKNEQKPYIYAVGDSIEDTVLTDVNSFILPLLAKGIDANSYGYMDRFCLKKNGEIFIECEYIPDEQREQSGEINIHRMTAPAKYIPSNDKYLEALECFVSLVGEFVCEYNVSQKENYNELMQSYGFDKPAYEISYTFMGHDSLILFGNKLNDSDAYYVYSPYTDIIATLSVEKVPFLRWSLMDFVSKEIFQRDIKRVNSITLSFDGEAHTYVLSGEGDNLLVTDNGKPVDTKNFRQLYIMLLGIRIQGFADSSVNTSSLPCVFTMQIVPDSNKTVEYKFYSLSTGRLFYTIDGIGEFYVSREYIDFVIDGVKKLASGKEVDSKLM